MPAPHATASLEGESTQLSSRIQCFARTSGEPAPFLLAGTAGMAGGTHEAGLPAQDLDQKLRHELSSRRKSCYSGQAALQVRESATESRRRARILRRNAEKKRADARVQQALKVARAEAAAEVARVRREAEEKVLALQENSADFHASAYETVCTAAMEAQAHANSLVQRCTEECGVRMDNMQTTVARVHCSRRISCRCFLHWAAKYARRKRQLVCRRKLCRSQLWRLLGTWRDQARIKSSLPEGEPPRQTTLAKRCNDSSSAPRRTQQEIFSRLFECRRRRVQVARCVSRWSAYVRAQSEVARRSLRGIVQHHRRYQQTALLHWQHIHRASAHQQAQIRLLTATTRRRRSLRYLRWWIISAQRQRWERLQSTHATRVQAAETEALRLKEEMRREKGQGAAFLAQQKAAEAVRLSSELNALKIDFKSQLAEEKSRSGRIEEECARLVVDLGSRGEAASWALLHAHRRLRCAQYFGAWSRVVWMSLALLNSRHD